MDALEPMLGKQRPPEQLLLALSSLGLHLLPGIRNPQITGHKQAVYCFWECVRLARSVYMHRI